MFSLFGRRGLLCNVALLALIGYMVRSMLRERELSSALSFYAAYHQDPVNQAIHFVFVPTLLYSFMLLFAHVPVFGLDVTLPGGTAETPHRFTYATLLPCLYSVYYSYLDPFSGWAQLYGLIVFVMYASVTRFVGSDQRKASKKIDGPARWNGTGWPLKLAMALQALGWYMQIHPGHAVFEGVKPALIDSLGQSFSVAPLFAFYEGLWAVGFQPELHAATAALVAERRAAMCAGGSSFPFCS